MKKFRPAQLKALSFVIILIGLFHYPWTKATKDDINIEKAERDFK